MQKVDGKVIFIEIDEIEDISHSALAILDVQNIAIVTI
jgi:hypothetical protein